MHYDLYVPILISVDNVLQHFKYSLYHPTFEHSFLIDELLAYLFYNHQATHGDLVGAKALVTKMGVSFNVDEYTFDKAINEGSDLLIFVIASIWPEFRPNIDGISYAYHGGNDLLIYMPYDEKKHFSLPKDKLVPWHAINSANFRPTI